MSKLNTNTNTNTKQIQNERGDNMAKHIKNSEDIINIEFNDKKYEISCVTERMPEIFYGDEDYYPDDEWMCKMGEELFDVSKVALTDDEILALEKFLQGYDPLKFSSMMKDFAKGKVWSKKEQKTITSDEAADELIEEMYPYKIVVTENGKINFIFRISPFYEDMLDVDLIDNEAVVCFYLDDDYKIVKADYSYGRNAIYASDYLEEHDFAVMF